MENLVEKVGGFGRYQKLTLVLVGTISSLAALTTYSLVFNNAYPKFICQKKTDLSQMDTEIHQSNDACSIWKNLTTYQGANEFPYTCNFDTEFYGNTIVTEWDLQCDKIYLSSLTQTMFMVKKFYLINKISFIS